MSIGAFSDRTIGGEMYIEDTDSYTADITVTNTYVQIGGFHKNLESDVVLDPVLGTFTIKRYGNYKFDGVASLAPSAGMILHFAVFVDTDIKKNVETGLDFQNNQDTNTFSGTGWLKNLNPGDVVSVRGKSSNAPITLTINHMNISIERRGRS